MVKAYTLKVYDDYDNLFDGSLSISVSGSSSTLSDGFLETYANGAFASSATVTQANGIITTRNSYNSSSNRSGQCYVKTLQDLKQYAKFSFAFTGDVYRGNSGAGSFKITLNDGGGNTVTLVSADTTATINTGGAIGGIVTLSYSGSLMYVTVTEIHNGANITFTALTPQNVDVSGWSAAYIKLETSASCSNGFGMAEGAISNIFYGTFFANSKGTQQR